MPGLTTFCPNYPFPSDLRLKSNYSQHERGLVGVDYPQPLSRLFYRGLRGGRQMWTELAARISHQASRTSLWETTSVREREQILLSPVILQGCFLLKWKYPRLYAGLTCRRKSCLTNSWALIVFAFLNSALGRPLINGTLASVAFPNRGLPSSSSANTVLPALVSPLLNVMDF